MTRSKFLTIVTVALAIILAACAPAAAPKTLRFAVSDAAGGPSDPFVREFVAQVQTLSHGDLIIEPVWDAAAETPPGFEAGVIKLVHSGDFALGLAASRAWDSSAFPAVQVLQVPFLITDNALAEAVASSPISAQILDSLASGGMVGLTLWPEDLRHPFSVDPSKPLLAPADFAGLTIRNYDSGVGAAVIRALGGNPVVEAEDYQGAESGLLQGANLTGRPAATGNVTFFPKYQVLFANASAFASLTDKQRQVLHQAAAATQTKAITDHPSEVEAAAAWCADGGTIVLASAAQVAAFETAAQPVIEALAAVPGNAELIASIHALKTNSAAPAGAPACAPVALAPTVAPDPNETWADGLPPNGVWQVNLTVDDLVSMGLLRSTAEADWAGLITWSFNDSTAHTAYANPNNESANFSCDAGLELVADFVRFTYVAGSACEGEVDDMQWRLDGDGLHLHLVNFIGGPFIENRAYLEAKPWQRIGDIP